MLKLMDKKIITFLRSKILLNWPYESDQLKIIFLIFQPKQMSKLMDKKVFTFSHPKFFVYLDLIKQDGTQILASDSQI